MVGLAVKTKFVPVSLIVALRCTPSNTMVMLLELIVAPPGLRTPEMELTGGTLFALGLGTLSVT